MRYPKPEEWTPLISEFRASGLQQKEFCAKHDLSISTFRYFLYKDSAQTSKPTATRVQRFLPVHVVASPAQKARGPGLLEAELRNGVVVRFAVGTDTAYVAELLAAVG